MALGVMSTCCDEQMTTIVVSETGEIIFRSGIRKYFELKEESIGSSKTCLDGSVQNLVLEKLAETLFFLSIALC